MDCVQRGLVGLLGILCLTGCGLSNKPNPARSVTVSTAKPPATSTESPKDDAAIFRVVINKYKAKKPGTVAIIDSTLATSVDPNRFLEGFGNAPVELGDVPAASNSTPEIPFGQSQPKRLWSEITKSYSENNAQAVNLVHVPLPARTIWMSRTHLAEIFKRGSWDAFREKFPGESWTVTFSRPGYSDDLSLAIVWVSIGNGPKSGGSDFLLLQRSGDTWKIVQTHEDTIV